MLSYIQTYVDLNKGNGRFILTGSQNFLLSQAISQTLAGRIALNTLLPLSIGELKKARMLPSNLSKTVSIGFYPRIYAESLAPARWHSGYIATYLERDVRMITQVTDLTAFQRFIKLCAGRIGQILNIASLAQDCGIAPNTAKAWLSLLEASYIIFLLHPYYKNFSKRLIKSPKLYFYDTGLACSLLRIDEPAQYEHHYLRGGLFESMIISDLIKQQYAMRQRPQNYYWRDYRGNEVDCIIDQIQPLAIEIKAGQTINNSFFDGLKYWQEISGATPNACFVVFAGSEGQKRIVGTVVDWRSCKKILKK